MWYHKKKWPLIIAIIIGVIVAIGVRMYNGSYFQKGQHTNSLEKDTICKHNKTPLKEYEDVKSLLSNAYAVALKSATVIISGDVKYDKSVPFIENGEMYISLDDAVSALNATMTKEDEFHIVTVESNGCKSQFIPEYNVIVFNEEPIILRSKPIQKDGHIFLPVDIVAKILNVSCFRDYDNGVAVLRGSKPLDKSDFATILAEVGITDYIAQKNDEIEKLQQKYQEYDFYSLARQNRLYVSDNDGLLSKWVLLDDFSIIKEEQNIAHKFEKNQIYILGEESNKNNLYIIGEQNTYSLAPEIIIKNDMVFALEKLIETKMENQSEEQIKMLTNAVSGEFSKEFADYKQESVNSNEYNTILSVKKEENTNFQEDWNRLCSKTQKGDIVLFRNNSSDSRYGYFNHCALVLDVDKSTNTIWFLQARNSQLGVGADLPLDKLSFDSFNAENYWKHYDKVVLCRLPAINTEIAESLTQNAYNKFNGYTFGYGGFYGAKQTTCVEMIKDALADEKIDLISKSDYQHRLKKLLKGEDLSIFLIPDDIITSENVDVIDCILK